AAHAPSTGAPAAGRRGAAIAPATPPKTAARVRWVVPRVHCPALVVTRPVIPGRAAPPAPSIAAFAAQVFAATAFATETRLVTPAPQPALTAYRCVTHRRSRAATPPVMPHRVKTVTPAPRTVVAAIRLRPVGTGRVTPIPAKTAAYALRTAAAATFANVATACANRASA